MAGLRFRTFSCAQFDALIHTVRSGDQMETTTVCSICDKPERQCGCDRFCCYCQGQYGVRLCEDGKYYCPDCREACEQRVARET
jgi:hypothetical protein